MTHRAKLLGALVGLAGVCTAAQAVTDDAGNPYQKIIDRNVFGLKPPPPPPSVETPKPPAPKITLTGITTMLGKKRALMKTPPPPGKPGEVSKTEQYFMLEEGGRDGEMEVLEINAPEGSVRVRYAGTEVSLNFVDNGAKPIGGPPGGAPGMPGAVPGGMQPTPGGLPNPGMNPAVNPGMNPGATPGMRPLPTRTLRLPTPGAVPEGATGYTPYSGNQPMNVSAGGATLPAFRFSGNSPGTPSAPQIQNQPAQPALTHEQQMILLELQREESQKVGGPPVPPTPLTLP